MKDNAFAETLGVTRDTFTELLRILYKYDNKNFKSKNFKLTITERLSLALEYILDPLAGIYIGKAYGLRREGVWYCVRWVWRHLSMDPYIINSSLGNNIPIDDFLSAKSYLEVFALDDIYFEKKIGFPENTFKRILKTYIVAFQYASQRKIYHIYAKERLESQEASHNILFVENTYTKQQYVDLEQRAAKERNDPELLSNAQNKEMQPHILLSINDPLQLLYAIKYENIAIKLDFLQDNTDYKIAFGMDKMLFDELLLLLESQNTKKQSKECSDIKALIITLEFLQRNRDIQTLADKYYLNRDLARKITNETKKILEQSRAFSDLLNISADTNLSNPLHPSINSISGILSEKFNIMLSILDKMPGIRKSAEISNSVRLQILLEHIIHSQSHSNLAKRYNMSAASIQHIIRLLDREFLKHPELKYPGLYRKNQDIAEYEWNLHLFKNS
jgi:hypothetical protein